MEKGVAKEAESQAAKDVQKIIGDHFNDQDPRVRTAAIKAMVSVADTMEEMVWVVSGSWELQTIPQKFGLEIILIKLVKAFSVYQNYLKK